jgi:DNA-binding MarR family transcriptional regulator
MQSSLGEVQIFDFPHSLAHLMSRASMAMWQFVSQKTYETGGITGMQASVLLLLTHRSLTTSMDLAREYKLHSSAVTRLVDRLVRLGMVERVPSKGDRRAFYLLTTVEGEKVASKMPAIFAYTFETLLDGIEEGDAETLRRCLRKILLNAHTLEELNAPSFQEDSPAR